MQRFAPVVLPSLGVSISQSGRYVELLVADCGLEVAFDGVHRVAVRVPKETHSGKNTVQWPSVMFFFQAINKLKTCDKGE